ncbi:MAG: FG-GAP repeat domain-containing protein, partial [Pseudomonadales bacterium]
IPKYTAIDIPFQQSNDFSAAHPFAASAIIDIDNDGIEELFLGGGPGQSDALLRYRDAAFDVIADTGGIKKSSASASFGATVIDCDGDGRDDLLVSRSDGVWLHRNSGGSFSTEKLALDIPADTTPMSVAVADLNRDGHFDLYVAGYIRLDLVEGQNIFNKKGYGGSSELFINKGDNTFDKITEQAGLTYRHNTFMGIFVDVDKDGFEDLIVAHDTGQVRTWRNQGDGTFANHPNPNSDEYSYPMGIGVGDYNNDGKVDFAFSNVGSTPPNFMVRGDLTDDQRSNWKWLLFENRGGFEFGDSAAQAKIADYEFSWGMVLEDLNLDGREDLIVAENYIGLPPHKIPFLRLPGRLMIQNTAGEFAAVGKEAGVVNKRYSITPILADFNADGYPDIVHVNIAGRSQAFLSEGGDAGFLKVKLPNRVSSIAATVEVVLANGQTLSKPFVSGEGLCSDPSHVLIFGLSDQDATQVNVTYIDGRRETRTGRLRNEIVRF